MNKKSLYHLTIFTLLGFPLIGYILLHFHDSITFWSLFETDNLLLSIAYGLGFGSVAALLGLALLKLGPFEDMNTFFGKMMKSINPSWIDVIFFSFCAGVGEEILFRGAIQPYLAVWPTAIIFVAIHGYINPKDKKMTIYGIFLILVSVSFGYMTTYLDLYVSMSAHFIYDVFMFAYLKQFMTKK